ncbi:MAG: PAS domain S-box protein [Bacteroidetes bacterium]|nr:PAS domain S-box protein [Bacteroidota bacterium]
MAENQKHADFYPGVALNCLTAAERGTNCGNELECFNCKLRHTITQTFSNKLGISKVPFELVIKSENKFVAYHMLLSSSYLEINHSPMTLLVMEDITSLVKIEKALMESEFRYKQITKAITDYIYTVIIHEDGEIQTIHTSACYSVTGYSAEEFEATPNLWFDIIVSEDKSKVLNSVKSTGNIDSHFIEHRIIRKDGKIIWVSNRLVRKRNPLKKIIHYDGIIQDITIRKEAEEALEKQIKLVNTMLDNLPIGIFMVRVPDGAPLIANKQAKELIGRGILPDTNVENLSTVYKAYIAGTEKQYPTAEMPISKGMLGEKSHVDDMEVERPDGSRILLEIAGCPVYDTNNNLWASLVGFQDITERKKRKIICGEVNKNSGIFSIQAMMLLLLPIWTAGYLK